MIRIVLADDHRIVRQGIRSLLEAEEDFCIAGEAADGTEAVRVIEEQQPDIAVLDLQMPGLNGIQVARKVPEVSPKTRVVILSMHNSEMYVISALDAGASGYVLKDTGVEHLVTAIREVHAGRDYLSAPFSRDKLERYRQRNR